MKLNTSKFNEADNGLNENFAVHGRRKEKRTTVVLVQNTTPCRIFGPVIFKTGHLCVRNFWQGDGLFLGFFGFQVFFLFDEFYDILSRGATLLASKNFKILKIHKIQTFKTSFQNVNFCKLTWKQKILSFTNFKNKISLKKITLWICLAI